MIKIISKKIYNYYLRREKYSKSSKNLGKILVDIMKPEELK